MVTWQMGQLCRLPSTGRLPGHQVDFVASATPVGEVIAAGLFAGGVMEGGDQ